MELCKAGPLSRMEPRSGDVLGYSNPRDGTQVATKKASRIFPKRAVADDVLTLSLRRIRECYRRYDHITVWFSGGKDSTVVLNLTLQVARELGRLPVDTAFFDEEAIPPNTVEYVRRVSQVPGVALRWFCLPIKHRNAASRSSPHWYPWAPEARELWTMPLPPEAITELPGFCRQEMPKLNGIVSPQSMGSVCSIMGIRTQESLNRYIAIANNKQGPDSYFAGDVFKHVTRAYPIYDWTTEDVWLAPTALGWDYNTAYDLMTMMGIPHHKQRCAPPFGEQPLERLWTYQVCWPELWAKMCRRVPGAATAARYSRTELYGYGQTETMGKHESMSWRDFCFCQLDKMQGNDRKIAAANLRGLMAYHRDRSPAPLPDTVPDELSGMCWKAIAQIAQRGDLKTRKTIVAKQRANAIVNKVRAAAAAQSAGPEESVLEEEAADV